MRQPAGVVAATAGAVVLAVVLGHHFWHTTSGLAPDDPPAEYLYLDSQRVNAYLGQIQGGLALQETRGWGSVQLNPYLRKTAHAVRYIQRVDADGITVGTFDNVASTTTVGTIAITREVMRHRITSEGIDGPSAADSGSSPSTDQVKGTIMSDLLENYLACWNEIDSPTRRALITKTWADDASYIDPLVDARGHDAIERRDRRHPGPVPGSRFRPRGPGRRPPRRRPVHLGSGSRRRRATGDRLRCRVRRHRRTAGPGGRLPRQGARRRYS